MPDGQGGRHNEGSIPARGLAYEEQGTVSASSASDPGQGKSPPFGPMAILAGDRGRPREPEMGGDGIGADSATLDCLDPAGVTLAFEALDNVLAAVSPMADALRSGVVVPGLAGIVGHCRREVSGCGQDNARFFLDATARLRRNPFTQASVVTVTESRLLDCRARRGQRGISNFLHRPRPAFNS